MEKKLNTNTGSLLHASDSKQPLIGGSSDFHKEYLPWFIKKIKNSSSNLLITGKTGTGKSLLARYVYQESVKYKGKLRILPLSEISETLFESELFGHTKGSFTSSSKDFSGKLLQAQGGTVIFEDIDTLPLRLQSKLLRLIQDKTFEPVGAEKEITFDARFIFTSNQDLKELVSNFLFREDLYHRINILRLHIPDLAERKEDISDLARHALHISLKNLNKPLRDFSVEAEARLMSLNWPGNIRQLCAAMERLANFLDNNIGPITSSELDQMLDPDMTRSAINLREKTKILERTEINRMLIKCQGNKKLCAERLGISLKSLYNKMKELDIQL